MRYLIYGPFNIKQAILDFSNFNKAKFNFGSNKILEKY